MGVARFGETVTLDVGFTGAASGLFPLGVAKDSDGNLLAESPISFSPLLDLEDVYRATFTMPNAKKVAIWTRFYDDALFTTETEDAPRLLDEIYLINDDPVSGIVDQVWDETLTGATHNIPTSAGRRLRQLSALAFVDGSVDDLSATMTSFITDLAEATDDFYNDQLLIFTSGALSGQAKPILDYDGTTKTITLAEPLTSAPANGDEFTIQATHIHPVSQIAEGVDEVLSANHGDGLWDAVSSAVTGIGQQVWEYDINGIEAGDRLESIDLRTKNCIGTADLIGEVSNELDLDGTVSQEIELEGEITLEDDVEC